VLLVPLLRLLLLLRLVVVAGGHLPAGERGRGWLRHVRCGRNGRRRGEQPRRVAGQVIQEGQQVCWLVVVQHSAKVLQCSRHRVQLQRERHVP
jgi:hypothetical protein